MASTCHIEISDLEHMIARGRKTWKDAAASLGVSAAALQSKAKQLGFVHPLRRRKLPSKQQLAAAIKPFTTFAEIGKSLGISGHLARYLTTKYRLTGPGRRRPRPSKQQLARDLKAKIGLDALAIKHELSKQALSKLIRGYNLPRPWRRPDRPTMLRFKKRGLSVSDVVDLTGLHISTICRICRSYNIRLPRKRLAAPRKRRKTKGVLSQATRDKIAAAHRGRIGSKANNWKGGHINGGYLIGGKRGYVHRAIAESLLNRRLRRDEIVHHMDQVRSNNEKTNLMVLRLCSHMALHAAMRRTPSLDQMGWLKSQNRAFVYLGDIAQ